MTPATIGNMPGAPPPRHNKCYWGHCDVDLIWGDIRKFVTDDVLTKYKRIFSRGHCSIYENSSEVNAVYSWPLLVNRQILPVFLHWKTNLFSASAATKLQEGDEVVSVIMMKEQKNVILQSKDGYFLCADFSALSIPLSGFYLIQP